MTSDLPEAYNGVYSSSKEIIKNNQRHLYINMLDLLNRATKSAGASAKNFIRQEHLDFWFNDILVLAFDEDKNIQDLAIAALESALQYSDALKNQNYPEWLEVKKVIVETYSKKLGELRQNSNSNWYKIWSLLIRILDKDILKGATVINTFLSIVEYGFRSCDYKVRAEAFICWKVLVEIFAKYEEIFSPKRIKLICIPLKSSQSKTVETAVNKFKVWWCFICKLSSRIDDHAETILLPFLTFCFGPIAKNAAPATAAQGKMYPLVKKMAVHCLIHMLGQPVKIGILKNFDLEQPFTTIVTPHVMSKYSKAIINACIEATILLTDQDENCDPLYNRLWLNLRDQIASTNNLNIFCECVEQISVLIKSSESKTNKVLKNALTHVIELLTINANFPFTQKYDGVIEVTKLCDLIQNLTEMLCHQNLQLSPKTRLTSIENIYNLERYRTSLNHWNILKTITEKLIDNELCNLEYLIKIDIWKIISPQLVNYVKDKIFEFRIDKNADTLNNWLMWPLDKAGKLNDPRLFECWKTLATSASRAEGYSKFTECMAANLGKLYQSDNKLYKFPTIVGYFIDSLDIKFDSSSKPIVALDFVNTVLSKTPNNIENYNKILEHLTTYVHKLGESQIIDAHPQFLAIYKTVVKTATSNSYDKSIAENFKRTYQDKLKTDKAKDKKLLKELKEVEKNDSNVFVIIPTLWTYNPEKLTEHQKEKRKEARDDIPALYNDMSSSQDVSLKPWTPKKVVIGRGKASEEIVLQNNQEAYIYNFVENDVQNDKNNANTDIVHINNNEKEVIQISSEENEDLLDKEGRVKTPVKTPIRGRPRKSPPSSEENEDPIEKDESKTPVKSPLRGRPRKSPASPRLKTSSIEVKSPRKIGSNSPIKTEQKPKQKENSISPKNESKAPQVNDVKLIENEISSPAEFKTPKSPKKQNKVELKSVKREEKSNFVKTSESEKKRIKKLKITKSDEKLLEQVNIKVKDVEKKLKVVRELKDLDIDTVEGRPIVNEKLRSRTKPEELSKPDESTKRNKRKDTSPKHLSILKQQKAGNCKQDNTAATKRPRSRGPIDETTTEKKDDSDCVTKKQKSSDDDSMDEIVESSQVSESVLGKKIAMRRSINASNKINNQYKKVEVEENKDVNSSCANIRKSPAKLMKSENLENGTFEEEKLKISEMETQPNVEYMEASVSVINIPNGIDKYKNSPKAVVSPLNRSRNPSPVLINRSIAESSRESENVTPPSSKRRLCDLDTEPNTELGSMSKNNLSSRLDDAENDEDDPFLKNSFDRNEGSKNNTSILSSPELKDTSERNAELLNSTLNISPINAEISNGGSKNAEGDDVQQIVQNIDRRGMNTVLVSEIDRKIESPVPRQRPQKHLTGRGAQFINMIRNKNKQNSNNMNKPEESTSPETVPTILVQNLLKEQNAEIPAQQRELLTFSKKIPSPHASPSVSILKRKMLPENFDDIETPLNKRKRVSFHDPPVSLTKEYERLSEEKVLKPGLNRCLMSDKTSTPDDHNRFKHSLKRKGRVDSMIEIARFGELLMKPGDNNMSSSQVEDSESVEAMDDIGLLRWNNTSASENEEEESISSSPPLCFPNEQAVLSFIFEKYELQEIIEKFHESGKTTNTSANILIKAISEIMTKNDKIKRNVLDILSEKHPKEFLEHAVQENLCSVICEKLNPFSLIEFICSKSKEDDVVRTNLLEQTQKLLANQAWTNETLSYIIKMLSSHEMNREEIFECTETIFERHKENQCMALQKTS